MRDCESKKPYVICVMSTGINDGEAQVVLPKISRVIWEWLGIINCVHSLILDNWYTN